MGIRFSKPYTPARRYYATSTFEEITASKPEKSLLEPIKKHGGRNNTGRITSRHRGGGHKRRYRVIDFKRNKIGVEAVVLTIEYDPNRTARIALVQYTDDEKRYIIAPEGLKVGTKIVAGPDVEFEVGNACLVGKIPLGTFVHNIEIKPGKGAQMCRSAGSSAQVASRDAGFTQLRLPSGETRLIRDNCYACIGEVSNGDHENISWGKAGRTRWKGVRPQTRGMAMNPIDHPMGGGEGASKSGGGRQHPRSPWGLYAKGQKTRKKINLNNKYIVKSRHANK